MKVRRYLRVPLPIPVRIKVVEEDQDFRATSVEDISWGGAFVVLDPPAKLGSRVVLEFILSEENVSLELWGRVVRTRKPSEELPAGMGVEFDSLDDDTRSLIQRLVDEELEHLIRAVSK